MPMLLSVELVFRCNMHTVGINTAVARSFHLAHEGFQRQQDRLLLICQCSANLLHRQTLMARNGNKIVDCCLPMFSNLLLYSQTLTARSKSCEHRPSKTPYTTL